MLLGIIYCFFALLWAGTAFMLGYSWHDCRDLLSRPVSFLLICGVAASVIECVLLMVIGVAMLAGHH